MGFVPVLVTRKSNVDSDGNLKNEGAVGVILNDHVIPGVRENDKGEMVPSLQALASVAWEHIKTPCPSYEDPANLHYLDLLQGGGAEDGAGEEDDDAGGEEGEFEEVGGNFGSEINA